MKLYINLFAKDKKCRYKLNNRTNKIVTNSESDSGN